jgi:predicted O-methyltransferase YrrM
MKDLTGVPQTKWGLSWHRPKAMKFNENWAVEEETANFLYGFTRMVKPTRFMEIGTFEGVSAMAIGQAMQDNNYGKLWTIDYKDYGQKEYLAKLDKHVECVIGELPATVLEIYAKENEKFDVAFIDDGHAFEDALRDITACDKIIRQFGYILGHDVIEVPSVNDALNAFLAEHPNEYEKTIISSFNGLFILRKLI